MPEAPSATPGTPLEPWQQRVVDELSELQTRLNRLTTYLGSAPPLGYDQLTLLKRQQHYMAGYAAVLQVRVSFFTRP